MRKLDRSQPFGEIYGSADARYEQHGIQFDNQGNELPGFSKIKIPAASATIVQVADDSELRREIGRLTDEVKRLTAALEDKDAAYEEAVGKLDTAMVDVNRLMALLPTDADSDASPDMSEVDQQLNLQAGDSGKKGK